MHKKSIEAAKALKDEDHDGDGAEANSSESSGRHRHPALPAVSGCPVDARSLDQQHQPLQTDVETLRVRPPSRAGGGDDTLRADSLAALRAKVGYADVYMQRNYIYTGWAKKTAPNFSCNNFGKYGPILIMFSLLHSQMN